MIYFKVFLVSFLVVACGNLRDSSRRPDLKDKTKSPIEDRSRFDKYNNKKGEDYCYNFSTCRNVCHQVYLHPIERGRCLDLSVEQVEDVYTVAFRLEEPVIRDLRRISEDDFNMFISVGTQAFNQYIYNYTIPEAKRVLSWLAEKRGIAKGVYSLGPDEYRNIFLNLMHSVSPVVRERAFHVSLRRGRDFYRISNEQNNDYAVYMAHQVIANDLCRVRHQYTFFDIYDFNETCILRVYCHEFGGRYVHRDDFSFISHVMEYDDIFDYISEEDPHYGLGIGGPHKGKITPLVCDRVCRYNNTCR